MRTWHCQGLAGVGSGSRAAPPPPAPCPAARSSLAMCPGASLCPRVPAPPTQTGDGTQQEGTRAGTEVPWGHPQPHQSWLRTKRGSWWQLFSRCPRTAAPGGSVPCSARVGDRGVTAGSRTRGHLRVPVPHRHRQHLFPCCLPPCPPRLSPAAASCPQQRVQPGSAWSWLQQRDRRWRGGHTHTTPPRLAPPWMGAAGGAEGGGRIGDGSDPPPQTPTPSRWGPSIWVPHTSPSTSPPPFTSPFVPLWGTNPLVGWIWAAPSPGGGWVRMQSRGVGQCYGVLWGVMGCGDSLRLWGGGHCEVCDGDPAPATGFVGYVGCELCCGACGMLDMVL